MAKGAKNCCCTGCEEVPSTAPQSVNSGGSGSVTFKGHPIDLVQQFCCACLPKLACVKLEDHATGQVSTVDLRIQCNAGTVALQNGYGVIYQGEADFIGELVDLMFTLEVVGNACYFALTSYALHITDARVLIDDKARAKPFYFCRSLGVEIDPYDGLCTKWTTYDGSISVAIAADSITPISRRQPCIDGYGNVQIDTDPINGICQGCGCLCTNACLIVQYPKTNTVIQTALTLEGSTYLAASGDPSYGPEIAVVKDPAGSSTSNCALQLVRVGDGLIFTGTPALVDIIAGNAPTNCPTPTAKWSVLDVNGNDIIVWFFCATCGGCTNITAPSVGCCTGFQIPRVLHCTIAKGDNTVSAFCECLPIALPLIYTASGTGEAWQGSIMQSTSPGAWCLANGQDVFVQLTCSAPGWTLSFSTNELTATPCKGTLTTDYDVCEPFFLTFTFTTSGCCGPSPGGGPRTLVFTITE